MEIFPIYEPSLALLKSVLNRVHFEEKKQAIKRMLTFSVFLVFGTIALVPVLLQLLSTVSTSGFIQYVSLGFSDSSILTSNIGSYTLSLLESFPVIELAIFLIFGFIVLGSLKSVINNYKTIRATGNHYQLA